MYNGDLPLNGSSCNVIQVQHNHNTRLTTYSGRQTTDINLCKCGKAPIHPGMELVLIIEYLLIYSLVSIYCLIIHAYIVFRKILQISLVNKVDNCKTSGYV